MLCLVTGLSGVGVSTVLESFKEDFTVLNFADIVMKISDIHSRGFIDFLTNYQLREISYNVIKYINNLDKSKPILIDTYCSVRTKKGYIPTFPHYLLNQLQPDSIILIEADAEDIIDRRNKNYKEHRNEIIEKINEHQEVNRAMATGYAVSSGCTIKFIRNDNIDECVRQLEKVLGVKENDSKRN